MHDRLVILIYLARLSLTYVKLNLSKKEFEIAGARNVVIILLL